MFAEQQPHVNSFAIEVRRRDFKRLLQRVFALRVILNVRSLSSAARQGERKGVVRFEISRVFRDELVRKVPDFCFVVVLAPQPLEQPRR